MRERERGIDGKERQTDRHKKKTKVSEIFFLEKAQFCWSIQNFRRDWTACRLFPLTDFPTPTPMMKKWGTHFSPTPSVSLSTLLSSLSLPVRGHKRLNRGLCVFCRRLCAAAISTKSECHLSSMLTEETWGYVWVHGTCGYNHLPSARCLFIIF